MTQANDDRHDTGKQLNKDTRLLKNFFDAIPRKIPAQEWKMLEAGLIQRVKALNAFLYDIYHEKKIVSDGVVPKEFTYESKGYMRDTETLLQVEWRECRNHHCSDSRSLRFRSIISPSVFPK